MSSQKTRSVTRREFLRYAGLAGGAALIAACQPKTVEVEKQITTVVNATPAPKEEVRLRLAEGSWVGPEGIKYWTDDIIPRFEGENPGIKVDFESAEAEEWQQKTFAQMVAGQAPDVMFAWSPVCWDWIVKGQALQLDEHFDDSYLEDFFPSQVVSWKLDGHLWGLPKYVSTIALAYNKDILDEAGVPYPDGTWDWDTYLEACRACTKRDDSGEITQWGTYVCHDFLPPWVWQNGGQWTDTPLLATKCLLDDPKSLEALKFVHDFIYGPEPVAPKPGSIPDMGWSNVFSTGKIAFVESHSWTVTNYARENNFLWDFTNLPKGRDGTESSLTFANGYIAYAKTKYPAESIALMRFLTSVWAGEAGAKSIVGLQPARRTASEVWDQYSIGAQAGYNVAAFTHAVENAGLEIAYKDPGKASEVFTPIWEAIWITGDMPLEQGVNEAVQRINSLFA